MKKFKELESEVKFAGIFGVIAIVSICFEVALGGFSVESITAGKYHTDSSTGSGYNRIRFDASRSSAVYDSNNTGQVFPANRKMYQIIKY